MEQQDALGIVYSVLSERWPDFEFKKSKKTWAEQTADRVLLMAQCQGSRWGETYYLNFGVYYLDIQQIEKPMSHLPKVSDWHLIARYKAFREMSTAEHNNLFSLADRDPAPLERKCLEIASFSSKNILPRLKILGNIDVLSDEIEKRGDKAFSPFNTQKIARKDIVAYVQSESGFRATRVGRRFEAVRWPRAAPSRRRVEWIRRMARRHPRSPKSWNGFTCKRMGQKREHS